MELNNLMNEMKNAIESIESRADQIVGSIREIGTLKQPNLKRKKKKE